MKYSKPRRNILFVSEGEKMRNQIGDIRFEPVGIIHSPFQTKTTTPFQAYASEAEGRVEVFNEYEQGLVGIERNSYIELYFYFHKSKSYSLLPIPHKSKKRRGVFATRSPNRPNPIGYSTVKVLKRNGNILHVKGLDVIDKTPLLDIKPYSPDLYPTID